MSVHYAFIIFKNIYIFFLIIFLRYLDRFLFFFFYFFIGIFFTLRTY